MTAAAEPARSPRPPKGRLAVKVYLVMETNNLPRKGQPSVRIVDAYLTRRDAQGIVDARPGTYIEKVIARKSERS